MRTKRGQMRIFEAIIACMLILMGQYFLSRYSTSISVEDNVELDAMAQNLFNVLEDQQLMMEITEGDPNWLASVKEIVESILPPDVLYNISMVSLNSGEVLADGITNISFENNQTGYNTASMQGVYSFSFPLIVKEDVLLDIVLIMDRSDSMDSRLPGDTHTKIYYTKIAACNFIDRLNSSTDRIGLVSFSDEPTLDYALTTSFQLVKNKINSLNPDGYTNIGGGIRVANSQMETSRENATTVIVFLSDGVANVYENSMLHHVHDSIPYNIAREYALNRSEESDSMGIKVYTIGLGDRNSTDWNKKIDEELLQQIQTDGYFYAPSAEDLDRIYQAIAEDLIYEVKYDVVLIKIILMKP